LTLSEKTTIANPIYLFSLTHRLTNTAYNFILTDTSAYVERYNEFAITEGTTVTLDAGEYQYKIYAQTSSVNVDPALSNELVEEGIVKVDFEVLRNEYTVTLNEKIYEIEEPQETVFLLLQNGSFLLQQNGSKIKLISTEAPTTKFLQQQDGFYILQQDLFKIEII
jgi:hypothetical protein